MSRTNHVAALLVLLLFGGMIFAWSNLFAQFLQFYGQYETVFRFQGILIPNPFVTPCFFGSIGYLVAVVLAVLLWQTPSVHQARRVRAWLLFCVLFGISVIAYESAQYFHLIGGASVSCNPGATPWTTPCFIGTLVFIVSFLVSIAVTRRIERAVTIGA